ncbi:MAG: porin [Pseudomonadota bacterium]
MNVTRSLPLCALAAISFSIPVCAQESSLLPTFYGRINITAVHNQPKDHGSDSEFVSNASRIGLQGTLPVTEGLEVVYQAEYQVNPDNRPFDNKTLTQRNTYLGIKGGFGTLLAGRNDTPTKLLQNRIDLFNDLDGDIRTLVVAENRPNDVAHYISPEIGGFVFSYSALLDGQNGLRERLSKSTSASLTYTEGAFYAGVGVDNNLNNNDVLRLVTQYRLGDLQLGALYERSESSTNTRGANDGVFVSAAYTMDKYVLKAQSGMSDQRRDGARQTSLGVDYNLNADSKLFALMTLTRADNHSIDNDQIGVGFEYRF